MDLDRFVSDCVAAADDAGPQANILWRGAPGRIEAFFDTARSQWNPETLREEPSDGATIREMFERENARRRRPSA